MLIFFSSIWNAVSSVLFARLIRKVVLSSAEKYGILKIDARFVK